MRSQFHVAIRIDFFFYVQSPLSRVCFLCVAQLWAIFYSSQIKRVFGQINFVFVSLLFWLRKHLFILIRIFAFLKHRGPFWCMLVRLKSGNLTWKSEWPKCWNIRTPGAYLGHVFIWRSLVQVLLDIFIHLPVVIWTFLTRDPLRVQPGARDRWTVKRRWRITTTILES